MNKLNKVFCPECLGAGEIVTPSFKSKGCKGCKGKGKVDEEIAKALLTRINEM